MHASRRVPVLLYAVLAVALTAPAAAQGAVFGPPGAVTVSTSPFSMASGDFDNDGKLDAVAAGGSRLSIMKGDGTGGFTATASSPVTAAGAGNSVALADLSGDGKLDLVATGTNSVYVYQGAADGSFTLKQTLTGADTAGVAADGFATSTRGDAFTTPYWLAVADLNGDGRTDIAFVDMKGYDAGTGKGSRLVTFLAGSQSPFPTYTAGADHQSAAAAASSGSAQGLAVGDFDADGKSDLAVAHLSNAVTVWWGNGDGTFPAGTDLTGTGATRSVATGDVDADGRSDLVVAAQGSDGPLQLWQSQSSGGQTSARFGTRKDTTVGNGPTGLALDDFDLDGNLDVVLSEWGANQARVLLGNGTGSGWTAETYAAPASHPPVTGDFTGDGRPDVLVPRTEGGTTFTTLVNVAPFRPGVASKTFGAATAVTGASTTGLHSVAVDGAGNVAYGEAADQASRKIYRRGSDGTLLSTYTLDGAGCSNTAMGYFSLEFSGTGAGQTLWVSDGYCDAVWQLRASDGAVLRKWTGITNTYDIAVRGPWVWVAVHDAGAKLLRFDASTPSGAPSAERSVTSFNGTAITQASGVGFDRRGNLWATLNGKAVQLSPAGAYASAFDGTGTTDGALVSPYGVQPDAAGNVWVVEASTPARLRLFRPDGTQLRKVTGFTTPRFIDVSRADGSVYVADVGGTGSVRRAAPTASAFTEGANTPSTPVAVDAGLVVSDPAATTFTGATVAITGGLASGQDALAFANTSSATYGNIAASYASGTGVLSLTSPGNTATNAQWEAALGAVTYTNSSDTPSTTSRTVAVKLSNSGGSGTAWTQTVSVSAVNDAPTAVPDTGGVGEDSTLTVAAAGVLANDSDPEDSALAVDRITASSGTCTVGSACTLPSGAKLTLRADGSYVYDTNGAWNSLAAGATATDQVTYRVTDAQNINSTATATLTITVTGANDVPALAVDDTAALVYTENAGPIALAPALTVSDVDDTSLTGATVRLSSGTYVAGEDFLEYTGGSGITPSWDGVTGTLTLTGTATKATWEAALRGVRYTNASEDPSTAGRTVQFAVSDASAPSATASRSVTIAATPDAPRIVPGSVGAFQLAFGTSGAGALLAPWGVSLDAAGNAWVVDDDRQQIVKFDADGAYQAAYGSAGSGNGQFAEPNNIAFDQEGNLYVSDSANNRVQKLAPDGTFLTRWGSSGTGGGQFDSPGGVAVDAGGNVYVADTRNHRVQKFTSDGMYLGRWGSFGTGDGQLNRPIGIAVDAGGGVYVADALNNRVQKFTSQGAFVAKWGQDGSADGDTKEPQGAAVDGVGNVYAIETFGQRVSKFSGAGAFLTKLGAPGSGDGQLAFPRSASVDPTGRIYVTDRNNGRIQRFGPTPLTFTENSPAIAVDPLIDLADPDSANLNRATVEMAVNYRAGQDVLSYVKPAGSPIDGSFSAGTLTLTGAGTVGQYEEAFRGVRYGNASDAPATARRTLRFEVRDAGSTTSALPTRTLTVAAVNDPPADGGGVVAVGADGAALKIPRNAAATDVRIEPTALSDVDGSTPTQLRILSVTGGTVAKPDGTTLTTGVAGDRLDLTTVTGDKGADLRFTPTTGRTADAAIEYAVVDADATSVNSAGSSATVDLYGPPTGAAVTVAGPYAAGQTLTATPGATSETATSWSYAWERCTADLGSCSPVGTDSAGHATSRTADTGRRFRVTVVASNAAGAASAVTSAAAPARTPGANGEIVFASDRNGAYYNIYGVGPSGGAVRRITTEAFDQYTWGLAPDGLTIATYDFSGGTSVRPVDLETGAAAAPVAAGVAGDYSPDGRLIAYQSGGVGGADDVFVANSDGSGSPTNLTSDSASDLDAAWSPDGTRITFASTRAGGSGFDIWVMAADGGSPARLTSGADHETAPRFSPDGTQLLYRCGADVCKMDADGTDQMTVVSAPGSDTHPYWSPDGTRFVFESDRAGTWDIWIADADGGNQRNLTAGTGDDVNAAWQPAQAPTAGTAVPDDTSPTFGDTLGAGGTAAAGSPVLTTTWSWRRCGSDGTGCAEVGTAAAYGVQAADVGKKLKLVKTATNAAGSDSTESALTAVVAPQAVDLEVTDTPSAASVTTGSSITWTVAVANAASGSAPVSGATISAAIPTGVTGVSWTCSVSGGGACASASGSGALVAQPIAALATGRTMTYVVTGTVSAGTTGTLSHTAAVTLPAQYADADGGLSDDAGTTLNNVPAVTFPTVTALAYTEQGPPLTVAGDLTLADADGGNLTRSTVKVGDGRGTGDVLSVSAGSLAASYDADTGTLTISGSASIAAYRDVLRSVAFANTLDNPSSATRTVEVRVSDGTDTSIARTRDIAFTSVPDGPVVTPVAAPLEYSDGAGSVLLDDAAVLADTDSTQISGATVTITGGYDERSDLLSAAATSGLTASWDGAAGRLTFSGAGSVASYQAALRAVRYRFTPVGAAPARTVTFRATDADGTLGLGATRAIVIALRAPVNVAAPTLSGAARESRALTADPGRWTGSAPLALSYRWQRCAADGGGCADVEGATGEKRELTAQDVGARLRVVVSGGNAAGGPVAASSEPSAVVVRTPLAPEFAKRPAATSSDPAPLITFAGEPGAAFECELDGGGFAPCVSPLALPNLADGAHELRVRQVIDGATSPAVTAQWKLDTVPPATPQIIIVDGRVQVEAGSETAAEDLAAGSFLCRIDGGEWFPCTPPYQPEGFEAGPHTIEVKFVDVAGNESEAEMDVVVVSTENADGGFVKQADGLIPRAGDGPAGGTVGVVGRALQVACILRSGAMRSCRVDLFATSRSARAVVAARGTRVGRGQRAAPGPGTSQMPVDVRLNARGRSLLRAGRATGLRFDFTIHGPRGEAPKRVTRFARVVLVRRFTVLFGGDSTRLTKGTGAYVRDLAQSLRASARAVRCVGNADDGGSAAYAQRVGLLRAQRVCAALRRAGLGAATRAVSRGKRRPRTSNATPGGRALNRRVEIEVTY